MRIPLIIAGAPDQVDDLVPTLLEAAGIPAHDGNYRGRQVEPMDGRSLLALVQGKTASVYGLTEAVGYELSGCQAVFKGAYKLIKNIPPLGDRQWHLYDLEKRSRRSQRPRRHTPRAGQGNAGRLCGLCQGQPRTTRAG
ncbi:MAG: hypothetical protein IPO13_14025 [Rhodocyclaceae bacterium]|nr:hypothetical protein [Rhodocyclaceae bacterium]